MSAYLIGHITIKNSDKWQIYVEGVRKSIEPFGAEVMFRGKLARVLAGEHSHKNTVVIKLPFSPETPLMGATTSALSTMQEECLPRSRRISTQ